MIPSEFLDPELLAVVAEDVVLGKEAVVVRVLEGRSEMLAEFWRFGLVDPEGVAAAKVGEDTDGKLSVGTSLLLDAIREDVLRRDVVATREAVATREVVATRGVVTTRVAGVVAERVPGTEEAMTVFPEVKSAVQSSRELPLMQQPKVEQ